MEKAKLGARGVLVDATPLEPVSIGKCATSHGKIVKFPRGMYAK